MSLCENDGRTAAQNVQRYIRGLPEDLKSMFGPCSSAVLACLMKQRCRSDQGSP